MEQTTTHPLFYYLLRPPPPGNGATGAQQVRQRACGVRIARHRCTRFRTCSWHARQRLPEALQPESERGGRGAQVLPRHNREPTPAEHRRLRQSLLARPARRRSRIGGLVRPAARTRRGRSRANPWPAGGWGSPGGLAPPHMFWPSCPLRRRTREMQAERLPVPHHFGQYYVQREREQRTPARDGTTNMNATTKTTLDLAKTLAKAGFHIPAIEIHTPDSRTWNIAMNPAGRGRHRRHWGPRPGPRRLPPSRSTAIPAPQRARRAMTATPGPPMSWSTTSGRSASRKTRRVGDRKNDNHRRPEAREMRASLFTRDHQPKGARP